MSSLACSALLALLVLTSSAAAELRLLLLHPLYTGSQELVLRQLGEHLSSQRRFSVTQLRWRSDRTQPVVNSSVHVFTAGVQPQPGLDSRFFTPGGVFKAPTSLLWRSGDRVSLIWSGLVETAYVHCRQLLSDAQMLRRLKKRRFHAALVDLQANECSLILAKELGLPVVAFWGKRFVGSVAHATHMLTIPSVLPTYGSGLAPPMGLWSRVKNTAYVLAQKIALEIHIRRVDSIRQAYLPHIPSVRDLLRDIDVVLMRTNFLASDAFLVPPNVVPIGCLQCRPPRPLPKELDNFMNSADEHGVLVFCLGVSGFDADVVPQELLDTFLHSFGKLRQKVVMRLSRDRVTSAPKNVLIVDWLPQQDVMAHPNTRLFISHCGMGSVLESLYHGVPILGVPIFLDQLENAQMVQWRGAGEVLDRHSLTERQLTCTLQRMLNSSAQYQQRSRRLAAVWRKQEVPSPSDLAADWVELVARFGGLHHLRPVDHHLSWVQYWLLDVWLLLALALALLIATAAGCLRHLYRKSAALMVAQRQGKRK